MPGKGQSQERYIAVVGCRDIKLTKALGIELMVNYTTTLYDSLRYSREVEKCDLITC